MFDLTDYPIVGLPPERLTTSSWKGHIPFAYFLMAAVRPRVVVELGVYTGVSLGAFAQANRHWELGAKIVGVDRWAGDPALGYGDEEMYQDCVRYFETDPNVTLLRKEFNEALADVADRSVTILHIDGFHTYEAARHDFEAWLPKLNARGVVLFHDTRVTWAQFGAYRLWAELTERYPAFELPHSFGLGVLAVGQRIPKRLQPLVSADAKSAAEIQRQFEYLGSLVRS